VRIEEYEVIETNGEYATVEREIREWAAEMMERALVGQAIGPSEPARLHLSGAEVYARVARVRWRVA